MLLNLHPQLFRRYFLDENNAKTLLARYKSLLFPQAFRASDISGRARRDTGGPPSLSTSRPLLHRETLPAALFLERTRGFSPWNWQLGPAICELSTSHFVMLHFASRVCAKNIIFLFLLQVLLRVVFRSPTAGVPNAVGRSRLEWTSFCWEFLTSYAYWTSMLKSVK